MTDPYRSALRDRVAWRLANVALRVGTPWYRNMIHGAIAYGMAAAIRDEYANVPPPDCRNVTLDEIRQKFGISRAELHDAGRCINAPLCGLGPNHKGQCTS